MTVVFLFNGLKHFTYGLYVFRLSRKTPFQHFNDFNGFHLFYKLSCCQFRLLQFMNLLFEIVAKIHINIK